MGEKRDHDRQVEQAFVDLIAQVKAGNPKANIAKIKKAFNLAKGAHINQKRSSGEPYIMHPIAVAEILADLKLDTESIVTALLHDTVEDTEVKIEQIEKEFGVQTAKLVSGVTKLAKIEYQPDHIKQAENFRKLLLAISEDIRVLLVKLADRVHNMRTLHFRADKEKRAKTARETMDIYAPLAERIGIHKFKNELQDLAFAELYPEIRQSILNRVSFLRQKGVPLVKTIEAELRKTLTDANIKAQVSGREKTSFSIWKKMEHKNVTFEQLSDIIAFRILVDDIPTCYQTLGAIHTRYHTIPHEFKDYISTPKDNGYKSLHTLVIGPEKRCIEIQIRTYEMHEVAELGVAAHWVYKQGLRHSMEGTQYRWVRELLDILDNAASPEEFMANTKLDMFYDQVFCFSPKGDLIALPRGATPVDFAFAVHSKVGLTCIGARVNGRIVPLNTVLENGDQVEILKSKTPMPSPSWEHFVVTGKACTEIRRFLRAKQMEEYMNLGRAILQKILQQNKRTMDGELIQALTTRFKRKSGDDLLAAIGEGFIKREDIMEALQPSHSPNLENKAFGLLRLRKRKPALPSSSDPAISIKGLTPGISIHFARCCHPIPGDRIVAISREGQGLMVHVVGCHNLEKYGNNTEDWVDVSWESNAKHSKSDPTYKARIRVVLYNEVGSVAAVTLAIAKMHLNLAYLGLSEKHQDFATMVIDIEVRGLNQLNTVIATLKTLNGVHTAERVKYVPHYPEG